MGGARPRMISQDEAASALRDALSRSSVWRELFGNSHPRVLPPGRDRVVQMRAFDLEEWIAVGPGGVYEYWFSERGDARRTFRTDDLRAILVHLAQCGLEARSMSALRRSPYDPPPGFRFSEARGGPIVVEWGEHGWAGVLWHPRPRHCTDFRVADDRGSRGCRGDRWLRGRGAVDGSWIDAMRGRTDRRSDGTVVEELAG